MRDNNSDRVRFSQSKSEGFKVKIFSRNYSQLCQSLKLHPYFVTGFCDGESSFIISISQIQKLKLVDL